MKAPAIFRALWLAGGLALLLGFGREPLFDLLPKPRALPRLDGATGKPWITGEFPLGNHWHDIERGQLPPYLETASSWGGGDEWQGRSESAWFKASRPTLYVGIAGYPRLAGCHVWAEFRSADGTVTRVDCPLVNPREQWGIWEIRRPAGAVAVRIIGEDRTSAHTGWIAFSHPYRAWPPFLMAWYQLWQLFTTAALVLTLVWAPGLLWCPRSAAPETRLAITLGAGPLALAATGGLVWSLGPWVAPQILGLAAVAAGWSAIGVGAQRRGFDLAASSGEARVFAVMALVVAAVIAKSAYSVGPQGELFRGTVSRNLEMSDRIDSRFSFYVVQAAAQQWGPGAPTTEAFFAPWTFFSRGPLAGLAAIPVVMATNGRPPAVLPENRWSPFDSTGFAAYRITMITLAGSVLVALFLMLAPWVGERWALIGAGLVAVSPFGVHEVMFTWPKWAATAWVIASLVFAHARRPAAAGLALGLGFLFHPLTLLWAPWIGLWAAGRTECRRVRPVVTTLIQFGLGAGVLVLPWMALGAMMPHLPTTVLAGQGGFLRYWSQADWHTATWETWWRTRWMNFANTFVPLHVYLADSSFNHFKFGSTYEASGRLVKFTQVWWNSLPFALGLGLWALCLVALARAWRTLRAAVGLFALLPAVMLVAYWGMDPLGLMRECGHPLFIALVAITVVWAARAGGRIGSILQHRAVPWLQLPETWLMLWMATLLNPAPWAVEFDHLDPVYLAINLLALLGAAGVLSRNRR